METMEPRTPSGLPRSGSSSGAAIEVCSTTRWWPAPTHMARAALERRTRLPPATLQRVLVYCLPHAVLARLVSLVHR